MVCENSLMDYIVKFFGGKGGAGPFWGWGADALSLIKLKLYFVWSLLYLGHFRC